MRRAAVTGLRGRDQGGLNARRHESSTALIGGIAFYGGAATGWLLTPACSGCRALLRGVTLLFASGVADDFRGFSIGAKVLAQVAGATVLLVAG